MGTETPLPGRETSAYSPVSGPKEHWPHPLYIYDIRLPGSSTMQAGAKDWGMPTLQNGPKACQEPSLILFIDTWRCPERHRGAIEGPAPVLRAVEWGSPTTADTSLLSVGQLGLTVGGCIQELQGWEWKSEFLMGRQLGSGQKTVQPRQTGTQSMDAWSLLHPFRQRDESWAC